MSDQDRSREQLISELETLRRKLATVQKSATARKIAEKKVAEQALQDGAERFSKVVEQGPMGVILVGLDARVHRVNRRCCEMLGYTEEEIIARGIAGITHPDDREADHELAKSLLRGEIASYTIEKRYVGKNEHAMWGQLIASIMHDPAGRPSLVIGMIEDITLRKRIQAALQESEDKLQKAHDELERQVEQRTAALTEANEKLAIFRRFAEASGEGFAMASLDGHIIYMNPALCRMLGEERPEDALGKHFSVYYSEDSHRRGEREIRPAVSQAGYWKDEMPMLSRQGRPIPTWLNTFMIRDERGSPLYLAVVITDITERKAAEDALRASEQRFRNYFEQGLIGMAVTAIDKRWLEVNDRLCEILGYSREELRRTNWEAITHPDDVEPNLRLLNPLLAGEIEHFTLNKRYRKKDGSIVYATIHTRAFRKDDGTVDHVVTLVEDITARKQAEDALRVSEEKYRSVVEACPDAVVMSNLKGQVLFASGQARRLLGLGDCEELTGRNVFDGVIENDRKRLAENMSDLLAAGTRRNTEYTSIRRDVATIPVETSSVVIRDDQGQPKAVMAVIRDITERKRVEGALLRERRTLKHMLEASDHERQLIAYDIHDGLAQELAGAIMQFQIYAHARTIATKSKDSAKAFDAGMTMLQQSHTEARRLISGVRPPILDESGVIAAIAHLVYDPAFDQGPKIEFRSRVTFTRLAPIMENVIYRIVQEGLSNARNHSKSKKILVSLRQRGDRLRIKIRDWGVGFNQKPVRENRFGLKGIRERARVLGGDCKIKSRPGEGTSIFVELPVTERELAP